MTNVAVVFAGGTGQRMNTRTRPKQFLLLHDKPIIVYTIDRFDQHPDIDAIVVVCLESWIPQLKQYLEKFSVSKVVSVVPGGTSGQGSIRNGVEEAYRLYGEDATVLIHDGVRPLVAEETITNCIACVKEHGTAVTVVPAIETIVKSENGIITDIVDRKTCQMARAPQCFRLGDLYEAHQKALSEGREDFIDSASLMMHYGHKLYEVEGTPANIKVTTPSDFYVMRAIMDAQEDSQIFGL